MGPATWRWTRTATCSSATGTTSGIAVDGAGNVFFADPANQVIREVVRSSGLILTVAGTGVRGNGADGVPATQSALTLPQDVAVDAAGNLYIADRFNNVVRKVDKATGL